MFAKREKAKYRRSPQPVQLFASSIGGLNIVGVPAAVVMGGPGAVFLDLAHSLNRLRNQVLRDSYSYKIQRKER